MNCLYIETFFDFGEWCIEQVNYCHKVDQSPHRLYVIYICCLRRKSEKKTLRSINPAFLTTNKTAFKYSSANNLVSDYCRYFFTKTLILIFDYSFQTTIFVFNDIYCCLILNVSFFILFRMKDIPAQIFLEGPI